MDDDSDEGNATSFLRWMGPTLGDQFPDLRGETQDTKHFSLHQYLGDSWGIVFMHPSDFTPVCTTELGAAQSIMDEFEVRNVKICGFSCDDVQSHRQWLGDIQRATGQKITFPLFCDPTRMHAIELGVFDLALKDQDGLPLTVRSVFIIDPRKSIALTMTYPSTVGRNFDEILRVVDALQRADKYQVATPANWQPGDKTIVSLEMDDEKATRTFGQSGYTTVDLPSESGKQLSKHYLRYTGDPVLTSSGRQSFTLALRITKPKLSWRPPKSFALTLFLPGKKRSKASAAKSVEEDNRHSMTSNVSTNDTANVTATTDKSTVKSRQEKTSPVVDYGNHRSWKMPLRPFVSLKSETGAKVEHTDVHRVSSDTPNENDSEESAAPSGDLLVDFGEGSSCNNHIVW